MSRVPDARGAPAGRPTSSLSPLIRPATPADLPAIEQLLVDADLPTVGVADSLETFVVAELGGQKPVVIGVAGLEVCRRNALLRSVAVRAEWRGRGLGRTLVRRLLAEAQERGIRELYLLTTTAEAYFRAFGFAAISRDDVPPQIRATDEFQVACPVSATVMARAVASKSL